MTLRFGLSVLASLLCAVSACPTVAGDEPCRPVQEQQLLPSRTNQKDQTGGAVAVDGHWAVIGSALDSAGAGDSGSAYVYFFDGTEWVETSRLRAPDPDADARFGISAAIDGDVIVIGADLHGGIGAAYVFRRSGMDWAFEQKLTGAGVGPFQRFAFAVAVDGDTIAVGAPLHNLGGSAFIFEFDGDMWNETQLIPVPDATTGDFFGRTLAVDGATMVIGAFGKDSPANAGAAFVYKYKNGAWRKKSRLRASDRAEDDQFGYSVDVQGRTVMVGANHHNGYRGAVYVFERQTGSFRDWTEAARLRAEDRTPDDEFGYRVRLDGNWCIIGAPERQAPNRPGTGYIFRNGRDGWEQWAKIRAEDREPGASFGSAVDVSGDRGLVGAEFSNAAGAQSGSAYAFSLHCPAVIESLNVREGGDTQGGVPKLKKSDDDDFALHSEMIGDNARMKFDLRFDSDVISQRNELDVVIESSTGTLGVNAVVFLKRWSTGQFDRIGSYTPTNQDTIWRIDNLRAARYVREGNGRIQMRIVHVHNGGTPFESSFDMVQANVR